MNNLRKITISLMSVVFLMNGMLLSQLNAAGFNKTEKAVIVKFTLPNGVWAQVRVIEDGYIKVADEKTGQITAFSVQVLDKKTGSVKIKVLQHSGESFNEIENFDINFKTQKSTSSFVAGTTFEVLSIVEQIPAESTEKQSTDTSSLRPPECCVTCGGLQICSNCTVTMSCGSCNTERCPQ